MITKLRRRLGHLKRRWRKSSTYTFSPPVTLPHRLVYATHHKTGTIWMLKLFHELSVDLQLALHHGLLADMPRDCQVLGTSKLQGNTFDHSGVLSGDFRGIHLIRDPRDMIVSGCFYHLRADETWLDVPWAQAIQSRKFAYAERSEPWLAESVKAFGDQTYREKLQSLPTLDEQLAFEMRHRCRVEFDKLGHWDYSDPRYLELKYEDLLADRELFLFHQAFVFLGIPNESLPIALSCAYRNSLFSGLVDNPAHIRSGKPAEWKKHLKPALKQEFLQLFGDLLIRLGYEKDDSWADEPATSE